MALIPGTLPNGTKYPNDPQSLLDTFASYLTAPEAKKNRPTITVATPTSGGTVVFNSGGQDETLYLNHDPAITGLAVTFPTQATSVVGQTIRIFAKTAVNATVTYNLDSQTVIGTNPTSYSATTNYEWQKVEGTTWLRIH
jgi:hypothetical protein